MKRFDIRSIAFGALVTVVCALGAPLAPAQAQSIPIADRPLFTTAGVPPLMMMVMSRDEQLFNKAYTDYTDLDGDGLLDTTYQDKFDYSGYFDPALCYTYSGSTFTPDSAATGSLAPGTVQKYPHKCSSKWSGNFLNWLTMSRLDMLRFVLYGGYRSTDTATATVLQRAGIPNDLHAWVKVYLGADLNSFTPFSQSGSKPGYSFCNATFGSGTTGDPIMRVAQGTYTEWAATALQQCTYGSGDNAPSGTDYTVKINACGTAAARESFCQKYTDSTSGTSVYKPVGLLQNYGEKGLMRFGLISGTYSKPRSGGVLRRNIGLLAANTGTKDSEGCAPGDEVNLNNGRFCTHPSASTTEGIIKTMNAFRLTQWNGSNVWNDCNTYGILNRNNTIGSPYLNDPGVGSSAQNCSAWGNPLSEMYAEAVRYISAGSDGTPTSAYTGGTDLSGLPTPSWVDPYGAASTANSSNAGGNPYCANCSILVLASGLNSFDSDELPATINSIGTTAAAATTAVGGHENVSGNYLVGRIATGTPGNLAVGNAVDTYTDLCTAKGVADLSVVRGICPDIPPLEGSYLMAGLAWKAWTTDLRPNLLNSRGEHKPTTAWNQVQTYAVALAENLPKFKIGSSGIVIAPLAQANNDGTATAASANWRSSFLGSVTIGPKKSAVSPNYVYGRDLAADNSEGSFSWVWEDSLWGNDHDNDVVTMLTFCVGAKCAKSGTYTGYTGKDICWRTGAIGNDASPVCGTTGNPTVAADEVLVRIENLSAYAGNAMLTGYTITGTGTATDGPQRLTLRPGGGVTCTPATDNSVLTAIKDPPSCWYKPIVKKFKYDGSSAAKQLENPLFYSAKYGGFTKPDAAHPGQRRAPLATEMPDAGDWEALDANGVRTSDPSNYFLVRDPTRLKEQLQKVFDAVVARSSPAGSVGASASGFTFGQTLAYQASYDSNNWVGDLKAFHLNVDGTLGDQVWSAAPLLPSGARNDIWIGVPNGATAFQAKQFTSGNLTTAMKTAITAGGGWPNTSTSIDNIVAWLKGAQNNEDPAGPYRKRDANRRLGDIVNSSPQVAGTQNYGYGLLANPPGCAGCNQNDYVTNFVGHKTTTTIFVGAGDGMLHAFDGSATNNGGRELFAYIPYAVHAKLGTLAKPGYVHTYFVDGTPSIGDAYLGSWKTVLVSSAGAGAPAVFALDVTNPSSFGTSNMLWEFNTVSDPDMGQFTGIPSAPALTADGRWVTAFGNGYNGASNKAKLFVIDLASGTPLNVDPISDAANAAPNGLSTATIVDAQGLCPLTGQTICPDGIGETIYAGDYLGNVWKFVLSGSRWTLNPTQPIFKAVDKAGHKQPITSGMFAIKNPLGGVLIYFGTGKYLSTDDNNPDFTQSDGKRLINTVYAVWDNGGGTPVTRLDLQEQDVTAYDAGTGVWTTTQNQFGYRTTEYPQGKMGWFLDLTLGGTTDPLKGERVIASPTGILNALFVNVFRPVGEICLPAGINSLLELDLLNGSAAFPSSGGGVGGVGNGNGAAGPAPGGGDIGNGAPLGSPNPIVNTPNPGGLPPGGFGCNPPGDPNCPHSPGVAAGWCHVGVAGYPNCPDPCWCQPTTLGYPNCTPPPTCPASDPNYPYCEKACPADCSVIVNPGSSQGGETIQCRAAWRQLR